MTKLPTTKLQRPIRRPASERGFTLIELLVVIIILGILAAVVVFAVSGVGDKGKSSAVSIDERTLQTAEEAYCAKEGRYADGTTLVQAGLLSDEPQYHDVYARQDGGPCNGWSFSIVKTSKADPDSGKWTDAADTPPLSAAPYGTPMRLRNGNVISLLFDFGSGALVPSEWDLATGQWTAKDPLTFDGGSSPYNSPVLIEDDPSTPASECGTNCGKIVVRTGTCGGPPVDPACQPWFLFNPQTGNWENLTSSAEPIRSAYNLGTMVQLHDDPATSGNQCGDNCGKILIRSVDVTQFELYDPKKANDDPTAFTAYTSNDPEEYQLVNNDVLPDGRVLIFSELRARLFDPETLQVSLAAAPLYSHNGSQVRRPVLPSGELLVTSQDNANNGGQTQIYTPDSGPGSWRPIASGSGCPTAGTTPLCHVFAPLPDGRVLAYGSTDARFRNFNSHTGKAWIFDPGQDKWIPTADLLHPWSTDGVLLDPRTGPCGDYCNKVLVVGPDTFAPGSTAYYTP